MVEGALRAIDARLNGITDDDPLASTLYLDGQLALVDHMLHYFDRASMAHSLEVRVPFLDHEFVEFCATIPTALSVKGRTTKYLLKRAARDLIPTRDPRQAGRSASSEELCSGLVRGADPRRRRGLSPRAGPARCGGVLEPG